MDKSVRSEKLCRCPSRQYKRQLLTEAEAKRMSDTCETAFEKLVIWTLLDTGLTVAEFCGLTQNNVNWMLHFLTVTGADERPRAVHMSKRIIPLVEHHLADNGKIGTCVRSVQRMVKAVAKRAGIERRTSPHVLRHTFAVESLRRGIELPILQKALGHRTLKSTGVYLNMSEVQALGDSPENW